MNDARRVWTTTVWHQCRSVSTFCINRTWFTGVDLVHAKWRLVLRVTVTFALWMSVCGTVGTVGCVICNTLRTRRRSARSFCWAFANNRVVQQTVHFEHQVIWLEPFQQKAIPEFSFSKPEPHSHDHIYLKLSWVYEQIWASWTQGHGHKCLWIAACRASLLGSSRIITGVLITRRMVGMRTAAWDPLLSIVLIWPSSSSLPFTQGVPWLTLRDHR